MFNYYDPQANAKQEEHARVERAVYGNKSYANALPRISEEEREKRERLANERFQATLDDIYASYFFVMLGNTVVARFFKQSSAQDYIDAIPQADRDVFDYKIMKGFQQ